MKAAVFEGAGVLSVREVPEPQVRGGHDVKLRPLACGICGTDLHILGVPQSHPGTPGVILGHEYVAEVVEVGEDVVTVSPGNRVAVRPIVSCGACECCLRGELNHCPNQRAHGVFEHGGLAEYALMPDSACVPIGERIPLEVAALTEPLACVMSGVAKAAPRAGEDAVVFGAGAAGLLYLAVLRASGVERVFVIEPSADRAAVAHRMGATAVIDPTAVDAVAEAVRVLPRGADIVIDAVGSQLGAAIAVAARRARIVLFGMNTRSETPVKQHLITERELRLLGSFVGQQSFPDAIRLLESGAIDFSPIASHVFTLEQLPGKLDEIRSGSVVKAIVTI